MRFNRNQERRVMSKHPTDFWSNYKIFLEKIYIKRSKKKTEEIHGNHTDTKLVERR